MKKFGKIGVLMFRMMKFNLLFSLVNYLILTFVIINFSSCRPPPEPPLTDQENELFDEFREQCTCVVRREIDINLLLGRKDSGYYGVIFDSLDTAVLQDEYLESKSLEIARKVFHILENKEKFNRVSVIYFCPTGPNEDMVEGFEFQTDDLK